MEKPAMRCYYEVFDIPREATADEIKKQYKKLALKWHPDKNVGNEDEATLRFKEVSTAYAVLSDPQERKWYDDHRDSILRGDDEEEEGENHGPTVNLWEYFRSSCFSGYHSNEGGFYTVYNSVFSRIYDMEMEHGKREKEKEREREIFVSLGNEGSTADEVLRFYSHWSQYVTSLSFSWCDRYNTTQAPSRPVRRVMEKENKRFRDTGRREYQERVRELVCFIRKRDKRMIEIEREREKKKAEEEEKRVREKEEALRQKKELRERRMRQIEEDDEERKNRERERKNAYLLADEREEEREREVKCRIRVQ
mmetsp:Transcript_13104/g.13154  ORF Transcript_13104/g.13154 Transcript_13104/m.13154 type:complete len:309 (+) Transcript_13104:107-1033(+)